MRLSRFFALSRILSASLLRTTDEGSSPGAPSATGMRVVAPRPLAISLTPMCKLFPVTVLFCSGPSNDCCCGVWLLSVGVEGLAPSSLLPLPFSSPVRPRAAAPPPPPAGEPACPFQSCTATGAFTGNRPKCADDLRGGGSGPSSSPISDSRWAVWRGKFFFTAGGAGGCTGARL